MMCIRRSLLHQMNPFCGKAKQKFPTSFMLKLSKNFNFELQKSYVPQKKSENMYNKGSARKSKISCKKLYFFQFFSIFATYLRTPRIFNAQFSESSEKKIPKIILLEPLTLLTMGRCCDISLQR